jgi:uncharacterized protein YjaZ
MTQIILHDTLALLKPYFLSEEHPKKLFERAKTELLDVDGAAREWQGSLGQHGGGFAVMQAAQLDGYDVVTGQQIWGLFNPTRRREVSAWEFELFESQHVMDSLRELLAAITANLPLEELNVYLIPADPANRSLMVFNHGLSAYAGVPREVHVQIFPSAGNLRRLPAVMARLIVHQLRRQFGLNTLGDWLVTEGLAACFVEAQFPDFVPWLVSFRKPDDWDDTLSEIARRYGLSAYDEMTANVYGSLTQVGEDRPPEALPLPDEELTYTQDLLLAALTESNPNRIAAYLFGDELVAAQGHQGMGVPPFAGYEVAYRLVKGYLDEVPLADALIAADILGQMGIG